VGKNTRQDSSSTNNVLNNNSQNSPTKRRTTATTTMAVVAAMVAVAVGVAPPTPLPLRVCGPPTSTLGPTPFRCGRVSGCRCLATPPVSAGYAGRRPYLRSSTIGWAATRAFAHSPWSAVGSSAFGSGDMVPMDGLVGSIVAGQLLQHHDHGPSCGHRLGG
jgi:hypothetical protein